MNCMIYQKPFNMHAGVFSTASPPIDMYTTVPITRIYPLDNTFLYSVELQEEILHIDQVENVQRRNTKRVPFQFFLPYILNGLAFFT